MKTTAPPILSLLFLLVFGSDGQTLKVVTLNIWSGLDYHGTLSMGEYESPDVRGMRLRMVEEMLQATQPDIVALQEVNPATLTDRIANRCGYDVVHQRVNSGLKIGSLGVPRNLNEGIAILARKGLKLEFVDVWSVSNSFGATGNNLSLHVDEHDVALVGKISFQGVPIILVNVHTIDAVPVDSANTRELDRILADRRASAALRKSTVLDYTKQAGQIRAQLNRLSAHLRAIQSGVPMLVMGDLNAPPECPEIKEFLLKAHLTDAAGAAHIVTWDAEKNSNVKYSRDTHDARGGDLSPLELLSASYDGRNSFINPSRGWVLQAEGEYAPQSALTNVQLGRVAGWVQYYATLFYPKTVLALRLGTQGLIGDNPPVQMLLSIGGNQTLRGSPQDRYLDRASSVVNGEIRRLGTVVY